MTIREPMTAGFENVSAHEYPKRFCRAYSMDTAGDATKTPS